MKYISKKIGIDARWMVGNYRGMGKYAHQLIKPIKEFTLLILPKEENNDINNQHYISRGRSFYPYWEQICLPNICKDENLPIIICPYNTAFISKKSKTLLILVVHDLIFLESFKKLGLSKSIYQNIGRLYRRFITPLALKNADFIVTVSEFTKQELITKLHVEEKKITVIPNTLPENRFNQKVLESHDRKNYIFTVSGSSSNKNLTNLLMGYSIYKNKLNGSLKLEIAGIKQQEIKNYSGILKKENIESSVYFHGYLPDEEMTRLYTEARGFIFASTFEGFGIPLIEAMASFTPLACSNTSSIPEIADKYAIYFNPYLTSEIASAMTKLECIDVPLVLNAQKYVREKYSEKSNLLKINSFWEMVMTYE